MIKKKKPTVRKRSQHTVSRKDIDPDALKVLYRLSNHGYIAYLVGGGVRDLLLGEKPKDFDVSTDAHPRQIKRLFRNCFLIGRRFRLAHIRFGSKVIETSTFRSAPVPIDPATPPEKHAATHDNTFGTPEEDAHRRDFTINALFYDVKSFAVIDHVGGLRDLDKRLVRSIGDPAVRFIEDPVRMVRAARFAARLGFRIERKTYRAILDNHEEIQKAAAPRMYEEIQKLFAFGAGEQTFRLLQKTRLLTDLLPEIASWMKQASRDEVAAYWDILAALDERIVRDGHRPPVMLFAALLYMPFRTAIGDPQRRGRFDESIEIAKQLVTPIALRFNMPKRTSHDAAVILACQQRLENSERRFSKRRFMNQELFKQALCLLEIGADAGLVHPEQQEYWVKQYREMSGQRPDTRLQPPLTRAQAAAARHGKKRRRRPPRRRTRRPQGGRGR